MIFQPFLVINRVSILGHFGHFGHKWGMVFALKPWYGHVSKKKSLFHNYRKEINKTLHIYVYGLAGTRELIITQL